MIPTLTVGQIHAQVSAIRKRIKNGARAFALRAPGGWEGPDRMQIDDVEHLVLPCASDLQAREALLLSAQEKKPAVLLCSIGSDELGDDVVARLAKRRVFAPQPRDILGELFSAGIIDPRVLSTKPLVDALLNRVPAGGYRPVAGGSLDLDHAWTALIEQLLGASVSGPSLSQMLDWSFDPKKLSALAELEPPLKQALADWLVRTRGESIRFMMEAIDAGAGGDLIPLGLSLGLVFSPEFQKQSEFHAARARLEKFFGGRDIDLESAGAWTRAAESVLQPFIENQDLQTLRFVFKRVDMVLEDLKVQEFAYLSNHSPAGLAARFDRFGKALKAAAKGKSSSDMEQATACLAYIGQHCMASVEEDRIARGEMALRLIRWLQTGDLPGSSASLPDLMEFYHREGGFLDWARNRLKESDVSAPLRAAFSFILDWVEERLVGVEKDFAGKLADLTKSESKSNRLIAVEDVLSKVVVPAARDQPVLLLVLDGMSAAVFRQLLRDVTRQDWTEVENEQLGLPRPVLAALPSVTQISRRALFFGKLDPGKQGTEKGEFAGNDFLFQATGSQVRPKLFLKGDLREENYGGLASEVRTAIGEKKRRVVGVVINAIDDHLDSGDQVIFTWALDRIKPFRELLKLAAEAERVVLVTSDHGHVLDFGTRQLNTHGGEAGDRYRLNTDSVDEGELLFEGTRVENAMGQKKVVMAWDRGVRYGPKKRGYHGGASPQEMVVPLAILARPNAVPADGWKEIPPYEPDWWRIEGGGLLPEATESETRKPKPKTPETVKGLELFEQAAATKEEGETSHTWIDALLDSPIYGEQSKLAVRGGLSRQVMVALLKCIEARGGSVMKPSLAQSLGVPLFRVDGLVQNVSRILNVDGYEVISFDRSSETITLNIKLLKTQFDIE